MEWNQPRYQLPRTFGHQPLQPAQPRYWFYDNEDDDAPQAWQRDVSPQSNRYTNENNLTYPSLTSSQKTESSGINNNNGNGGMLLQSFSSLGMPQLEDSSEIQSFFLPQNSFVDNQYLSQHLPPAPSQLSQQQPDQQYGGQFLPQFSEFPAEAANYFQPPMAFPTARSSDAYFPEVVDSIPTLHNVHCSVPTLPPTLGSMDQVQQVQQAQISLEDHNEEGNNITINDTSPCIFDSPLPMAPTNTETQSLPMLDCFSARSSSIDDDMPPEYSPATTPIGQAKREGGLSEPFTQMALAREPKFSPDKRKLCCVEGCKSQARAFNRCKRHGGSKRCSSIGCTKSVQSRGLCIRHGGGSRCQEPGCTRASQSHGRCKMHGGGRPCVVVGCEKKAHLKRLCRRHGGGAKCCVAGCDKWAQRQGMCMTHSKVVTTQPQATGIVDESGFNRSPPQPFAPDSSPSLRIFDSDV